MTIITLQYALEQRLQKLLALCSGKGRCQKTQSNGNSLFSFRWGNKSRWRFLLSTPSLLSDLRCLIFQSSPDVTWMAEPFLPRFSSLLTLYVPCQGFSALESICRFLSGSLFTDSVQIAGKVGWSGSTPCRYTFWFHFAVKELSAVNSLHFQFPTSFSSPALSLQGRVIRCPIHSHTSAPHFRLRPLHCFFFSRYFLLYGTEEYELELYIFGQRVWVSSLLFPDSALGFGGWMA